MKVRADVCYNVNYTLAGKILLVGIKGLNSFVKLEPKHADAAIEFIDRYKEKDIEPDKLNSVESKLYRNLDKVGYLDNEVKPKEAFNEFKRVGKLFFSIRPKGDAEPLAGCMALKITLFVTSIVAMLLFIGMNAAYIPSQIDYVHMKLWEIIFTISVFPGAVLAVHEIGHCFVARCVGVKIDSVSLGWFFIYPLVLVQYYGLNLEKQSKKIMVMAGGVYFNLIMAFLGILLKVLFPAQISGAVIDIWISANISTIITNLGLFGMTDGYFIASTLIGIMDIRLKGYKYLNMVLNRKKENMGKDYKTCGLILMVLFVTSLMSVFTNLNYWLTLFALPKYIFYVLFAGAVVVLVSRFFVRVKRVFG